MKKFHQIDSVSLLILYLLPLIMFLVGYGLNSYFLLNLQEDLDGLWINPYGNQTIYEENPERLINNNDLLNGKNILADVIYKEKYYLNYEIIDNKLISYMPYDSNTTSKLFFSNRSINKLFVYNLGHGGNNGNDQDIVNRLLNEGYDVIVNPLPLLDKKNEFILTDIPNIGKYKLITHNDFYLLDNNNFSSMSFFFDPHFNILDYAKVKGYDEINIIGISTGGLTATIMGAFSDEYTNVISIAGPYPFFLKSGNWEDLGDYEQIYPELYTRLNYLELYALASEGDNRKYIQVINEFDGCCFRGRKWQNYIDIIPRHVQEGEFIFIIDDTHNEHKISEYVYNELIKLI